MRLNIYIKLWRRTVYLFKWAFPGLDFGNGKVQQCFAKLPMFCIHKPICRKDLNMNLIAGGKANFLVNTIN
ncbi:unnamed protein product [Blepharisma stoltei]|uniref:Uncharacterized protein n=1 Tax=Blepharisma stoltei TaxID=1481888 RepID=A0AAU9J2R9_9CILI|nr:unnamed protein product [Blepharisma stoltei]